MSAVGPSAPPPTECARGPFGPTRAPDAVPSLEAACRVAQARGVLELRKARAAGLSDDDTVRRVYMQMRAVMMEWRNLCSNLEREGQ